MDLAAREAKFAAKAVSMAGGSKGMQATAAGASYRIVLQKDVSEYIYIGAAAAKSLLQSLKQMKRKGKAVSVSLMETGAAAGGAAYNIRQSVSGKVKSYKSHPAFM